MTISALIHEKSRAQEKRYRTFIFLISKLLLVSIFSNFYLNQGVQKILNFQFDKDSFISIIIIIITFFFVSFLLDKLEERFINRANIDEKFREKILGQKNFIEGAWFIATIENGKIIEYALAVIWYSGGRTNLKGDLYKINENGMAYSFGYYTGLVGEFFSEQDKYIYAYERKSDIEKNVDSFIQLGGESYGKGEYFFDFQDGIHTRLKGGYFDPVTNQMKQLKGIRVKHMQEKYGLSSDVDLSKNSTISEMHGIFSEINEGIEFKT